MDALLEQLYNYNYWKQTPPLEGYVRPYYLDKIKQFTGNRLIKVLVGQRRCGKSFVMRQIIDQLIHSGVPPKNVFYLNKEWVELDEVKNFKQLHNLIKAYEKKEKPEGKKYIFIDEIQLIDEWEKLINSLSQDHTKKYEIFVTGSNSRLLSGELATLLSGRYVSFEVLPFSYTEFIGYRKLMPNKESLLQYLKSGGLPELFHLDTEETRQHYIKSLKDTVILRDIVQRYKTKDAVLLENLFKMMVANIGSPVSLNTIDGFLKSHKLKAAYETLVTYTDHLLSTFLVHECPRYNLKGKALLAGARKYYVNDIAFRNYLSATSFEYGLGQILENYVYLHYRSLGYTVHTGILYGKEIDFVLEKDKERKYVQVAYLLNDKKVIEREFGNLTAIKDNYEKIVVSLDDVPLGNLEGIKHVCAWDLS